MLTLKLAIAFFRGNFYIAYIRLLMNRELILNGHQDFLIQYFLDFLRFFIYIKADYQMRVSRPFHRTRLDLQHKRAHMHQGLETI
jgi:cytidylate kinase